MLRSRASSARENSASYGGRLRMCDDEPARPVRRDVSALHPAGRTAAERFLRQLEQPGGIVPHEIRHVRGRQCQELASARDRGTEALRTKPVERFVQRAVVEQEQLAIREPADIARFVRHARVHAIDFGSRAQLIDPCIDAIAVIGDRIPVRSGEDDVQLIEAAERGEKRAERRNHATIAREQRQHVCFEREASCAFGRDGEDAERGGDDERAPAVGPCDENVDQTRYVTLLRDRDASPSPPSGARERTFRAGSFLSNRAARDGIHRGRARSARA